MQLQPPPPSPPTQTLLTLSQGSPTDRKKTWKINDETWFIDIKNSLERKIMNMHIQVNGSNSAGIIRDTILHLCHKSHKK